MTERRLVLIGGTAGVGKTGVARRLAGELGAGWLQLDTLWLALTDALAPGSDARRLLDIDDRLRHGHETAEVLVDRHIAASGTICAALRRPLEFELQAHESVVADGAWLLPEFAGSLDIPGATVSSVFLHEPRSRAPPRGDELATIGADGRALARPEHSTRLALRQLVGRRRVRPRLTCFVIAPVGDARRARS